MASNSELVKGRRRPLPVFMDPIGSAIVGSTGPYSLAVTSGLAAATGRVATSRDSCWAETEATKRAMVARIALGIFMVVVFLFGVVFVIVDLSKVFRTDSSIGYLSVSEKVDIFLRVGLPKLLWFECNCPAYLFMNKREMSVCVRERERARKKDSRF